MIHCCGIMLCRSAPVLLCLVSFPFSLHQGTEVKQLESSRKWDLSFSFHLGKKQRKKEWIYIRTYYIRTFSLFLHTFDLEPAFLFHLCSCPTSTSHGALGTWVVGFVQAQNVISKASAVCVMPEHCNKGWGGCIRANGVVKLWDYFSAVRST